MNTQLLRVLVSLTSGAVFGFGLSLSGMLNPVRVRGFLDITGNWDPSLAFVLGGAVGVTAMAWRLAGRFIGQHSILASTCRKTDQSTVV